jgi:hypothetical protein
VTISTKERQRLAAILGMLGSDQAGERAAAGLQAEAFRQKHGLTWDEVVNGKTVYLGGNPPWHTSEPPPPAPTPAAEPVTTWQHIRDAISIVVIVGLPIALLVIILLPKH